MKKKTKPKRNRRKEIIKTRKEINEKDYKKRYKGSMNPRGGCLKR